MRPDLRVTLERAHSRAAHALTNPGPISDLHAQFANLVTLEPHAIDITHVTGVQTLDDLRASICNRAIRLP